MKIIFLGQNGFLIESKNSTIIVDPYLSDSVEKIEPLNKRKQPIDDSFLHIKPNAIVITHAHADHYDEETLDKILGGKASDESGEDKNCMFLSPPSVFFKAKARYPWCNHVIFRNGTSVTIGDITFRAVKAEHSDAEAIGVIISAENKKLYITGDTLYSETVFESVFDAVESLPEKEIPEKEIPKKEISKKEISKKEIREKEIPEKEIREKEIPEKKIDVLFLPVNGRGNNMNAGDAGRFAARLNPDFVVPVHFGMFDDLRGAEVSEELKTAFKKGKIIIPEIYKEIKIK